MPLTKATTNVVDLNKDTSVNSLTLGRGSGNINTNAAFGLSVLATNTTGQQNTATGANSLFSNTTGSYNTAIGTSSLYSNTTGNANAAHGVNALYSNTTGINNTAIGAEALYSNTTGGDNSSLGFRAGYLNTIGSGNVFIGAGCNGSSATVSNEVNIFNSTVTARFAGAASAWSFVSDERDKKDIEDLTIGLDFINQLKSRKFKWDIRNCDVDKGKEASGFIAQEVLQVIEEYNAGYTGLVDTNNPDQYTFATSNLIPILVKAVQELSAKVAELEAK
jgi:hypothetical protein